MALTGQLNDLSLAELIEFFCNQRKTGRLSIAYKRGAGVFYVEGGDLIDAQIGKLRGVEAVYFALTLPNASFNFVSQERAAERTIKESWTQVILEGLRRFDEGHVMREEDVFADERTSDETLTASVKKQAESEKLKEHRAEAKELFAQTQLTGGKSRAIFIGGVVFVVVGVTTFGALAGWSSRNRAAKPVGESPKIVSPSNNTNDVVKSNANENSEANENSSASTSSASNLSASNEETSPSNAPNQTAESIAARRERELRERQRQIAAEQRIEQQRATMNNQPSTNSPAPTAQTPTPRGGQTVTVRVTVDADGHVTQASVANHQPGMEGYEAAALRAARNRRFPAGQAGMQTMSIKIN